jgi:hypothetical protein
MPCLIDHLPKSEELRVGVKTFKKSLHEYKVYISIVYIKYISKRNGVAVTKNLLETWKLIFLF